MLRLLKALAIMSLLTVVGCSHTTKEHDETIDQVETVHSYFTGTIKKIISNGASAIVQADFGGSEGEVIVDLAVNSSETFQVGDEVKVGYDGIIMESNPAQIHTLSVELINTE